MSNKGSNKKLKLYYIKYKDYGMLTIPGSCIIWAKALSWPEINFIFGTLKYAGECFQCNFLRALLMA